MFHFKMDYGQLLEGRTVGDVCYLFNEGGSVMQSPSGIPVPFMTFPVKNGRIVNRHPDRPDMQLYFDTIYCPDRSGPGELLIGRPKPPSPPRITGLALLILWLSVVGVLVWNFIRLFYVVGYLLVAVEWRWLLFRRVFSLGRSPGKRSVGRDLE
jgi:hypothetical protein